MLTLKFDVLNVLGAPGLDQIFGDPDAADIVFTSGADVLAVGINVTHQVFLTGITVCHLDICLYICIHHLSVDRLFMECPCIVGTINVVVVVNWLFRVTIKDL